MEPIQIFFFITCQSQDKKDRGESECHWSPRWQILAPQPPLSALIGDLYYFPLKKHCPENVLEYIENILKYIENMLKNIENILKASLAPRPSLSNLIFPLLLFRQNMVSEQNRNILDTGVSE